MSFDETVAISVNIKCQAFDKYTISIKEFSSENDEELRDSIGTAMCIYVRREIRSLTETDLDNMLDAMYTLWSVDEKEGQELYGVDYHSASYFLNIHHFNAAWQDADHIHEGNGFMAQHIKMTNIFEASMQSINPAVAIPYWDFTIESAMGLLPYQSFIASDDVFGSMTVPKDITWGYTAANDIIIGAAIPDGRWAFLKADLNLIYPVLNYGYGYMRAPWNMNPR